MLTTPWSKLCAASHLSHNFYIIERVTLKIKFLATNVFTICNSTTNAVILTNHTILKTLCT